MPYNVNNNQFTAQNVNLQPVINPSPLGGYAATAFGTKCVMAANIDRVVLAAGDGENSNYTSSWWHYDIDNRQWTRTRPSSSLSHNSGGPASTNGFQDYFGVARGDNKQIVYHPDTGVVWFWGGNAGQNVAPDEQDGTFYNHYNSNFGVGPWGVYQYDPTTHGLTAPSTVNWLEANSVRYLSAAQGWDPTLGAFLQVMGESAGGGFSITDTKIYKIDPSPPPGGTITLYHQWAADGVAGPLGRTNIGHQFVYHTRARKWILFGGNSSLGGGGYSTYSDTWMYDAPAKRWTRLADGPEGRAFAFLTYDTQNNVCILTGGLLHGSPPSPSSFFAQTTWAYSLEQNKWFNLGVNFARECGGAVYDPTRNLHIYTPGNDNTDTDVYTFRYAVPRATATTRVWYGIKPNTSAFWAWPEKHTTATYLPSASPTTSSGVVYIGNGDTANHTIPNAQGSFSGGTSYQQNLYSMDLYAKFASPTTNAGIGLAHAYCETAPHVMPKHPDYYGLTADPKRRVLWSVPGNPETSSVASGDNCTGESDVHGDDALYLHGHLMTFDPVTGFWTDVSTNNDIQFPVVDSGNRWPWVTWYDALTDQLMRIKDGTAGVKNVFGRASNLGPSLTWSSQNIPNVNGSNPCGSGSAEMKRAYWAFDPQRRLGYWVDREYSGHLYSFPVDGTPTLTDLGVLPGTPLWDCTRVVPDREWTVFDYNARLLVYIEEEDAGDVVWTYNPDTLVWTNISTLPKQALDGTSLGSDVPSATSGGVFDPDNNLVLIFGFFNNAPPSGTLFWAIRLSDMGVAAPAINPVPDLVSISPASCVQNATVLVQCNGFGASFVPTSVVQWDGVAQPTTFVNADTLTFTVTSTLSSVLGPHNVTVFNPTPGGGTSLATVFTVTSISNPTPSLTSLNPASTPFNSGTLCTITGSGFLASSVINWDGAAQPTTFISSTQVSFSVTGPLASVLGAHSVTVTNPPPGGGTSNSLTFTVTDVTPVTQTGIFVGSIM